MFRIQHAAMLIACPHCQSAYEIDTSISDAVFVCHRCGNSFQADHEEISLASDMTVEEQLPLFGKQPEISRKSVPPSQREHHSTSKTATTSKPATAETRPYDGIDTVNYENKAVGSMEEPLAPASRRIWPWLISVLMLTIVSGFWLQKDDWLDNRWFRSTAINAGLPLKLRDKDWRVIPESVHAQWIIRNNDSRALVIEGRVENLLTSELGLPKIEVAFFDKEHPDQILISRLLEITLPPAVSAIRRAPFMLPDRDIIPVPPLGQRGFILLLESLPEQAGDFALTARVGNPH